MLEAQAMPPEDHRQPTEADRKQLELSIKTSLEKVDWAAVRAPGRIPLVRVTRNEFQFAVEDLFGVRVELDHLLPADPEGLSGFSNDHSSLVMTAKQFSRYLKAAEVVAEAVVDQSKQSPLAIHYEVEDGTNASWKKPIAKDADGSRGWAFSSKLGNKYQAVSKTFDFPRTGRYRIRMRARSKGPGDSAAAWIAVDSVNDASRETGILVQSKKLAVYETELFITKGRHTIIFGYDFYGPLWLPESPKRAQLKLGQSTFDPPPYDRTGMVPRGITIADLQSAGISIPFEHNNRSRELLETINNGYFVAVLDNLMLHKFHYEKGYLPVFLAGLGYDYQETVVPAFNELAKISDVDRARLEKLWESRQPKSWEKLKRIAKLQREAWTKQDQDRRKHVGDLFVDWIKLEAKTNGHSVPANSGGIASYLDQILPRAFRDSIEKADRQRFLKVYHDQRAEGVDHDIAFQRMLIAILLSPKFLYRTDGQASIEGVSKLEGYPLASRLASFLWSSLPDSKLFQAASQKELLFVEAIDRQVERMLNDDRRRRLASLFTEQWLNLADIGLSKEPDKELFRYFSWRLAEDMRTEVTLMFDQILLENRSVLELLDGETVFLNERLARLYGIPGISGDQFRRVKLSNQKRGGLLGTAAVLTSTSLATRTSPVRRGQFVMETLLGVDLPSPPANVPELNQAAGQSRELSLRESLAQHRNDSRCAGCHKKIDPLGFVLENYDWIGRWRDHDPSGLVDSSARMPDGRKLSGAVDLKKFLVREKADQFATALTRALLKYALGRDLEYYDEDAVRVIVSEAKNDGYRARTLIKAIARSYPFRYREIKESANHE